MKKIGSRTLQGILEEDEDRLVLDNDLSNRGWRITGIQVVPNLVAAMTELDAQPFPNGDAPVIMLRVASAPGLSTDYLAWANDQVVAAAWWQMTSGADHMINFNFLFTSEMYITNLSHSRTGAWAGTLAYQIELEQYDISDYEQVVAITKERAQS